MARIHDVCFRCHTRLAQMGEAGGIRIAHLKNKDIHGEELPSQVGYTGQGGRKGGGDPTQLATLHPSPHPLA